ncbi:protein of unknown function [Rhodovastum atsumiense]|nr:protein of unknown function [Rhodovastum atsumiense]
MRRRWQCADTPAGARERGTAGCRQECRDPVGRTRAAALLQDRAVIVADAEVFTAIATDSQ